MWGDVFILSPLLGLMVALYGSEWETRQVALSSLMGVLISALMHWTYTLGKLPEAHTRAGMLTSVGWVHSVYMAAALTIIILFYFCTPHPAAGFIVAADILLVVHVIAGTHLVLGFVHPVWYPDRPHKNPQTWIVVIGVALILTVLTFWQINSR